MQIKIKFRKENKSHYVKASFRRCTNQDFRDKGISEATVQDEKFENMLCPELEGI